MQWLLIGFTAATGVLNTIQAGSNTTLNKLSGTPLWSATVVFAVALCTTLVAATVSGQHFSRAAAMQVPWWAWIGGMFGAVYILCMMIVAEKVGAAVFMGVTVTAAIITSLVLDHFGLLGFAVHRAGVGRIAGGLTIIAGLCLIAKY